MIKGLGCFDRVVFSFTCRREYSLSFNSYLPLVALKVDIKHFK